MDAQQKVLAAFEVEHKEHLESLRSLLGKLAESDDDMGPRLEEAFRRVHSLKGGARVCGLQTVEEIAHHLESHFSRIREGKATLDRPAIAVANEALDSIEDCMTALWEDPAATDTFSDHDLTPVRNATSARPSLKVHAVAGKTPVVARQGHPAGQRPSFSASEKDSRRDIESRIKAAFRIEYREYVTGIRVFLSRMTNPPEPINAGDWDEPLRFAHSMRGAARAAGIEAIERIARELETRLLQGRENTLPLNEEHSDQLRTMLTEIENIMGGSADNGTAIEPNGSLRDEVDETTEVESSIHALDRGPSQMPESQSHRRPMNPAASLMDTVRVSTDSLNQLLRTSAQIVGATAGQDEIVGETRRLNQQLDELDRQRVAVRKGAHAGLLRSVPSSLSNRWERYLDFVDRQTDALRVTARRIQRLQQRSAWLAKSRSQQIHDDVLRTRMAPAESVFQGFRKLIRDLAVEQGKQVDFRISGLDARADRMVLQTLKDPLIHMLCNAVVHGIEPPDERRQRGKNEVGRIDLKFETLGHRLCVTIEDDGRGVDRRRVAELAVERGMLSQTEAESCTPEELAALIFRPGLSTSSVVTKVAGRGMGLSVVHEAVSRLQGEVRARLPEQGGTVFVVSVPVTVSTHHLLLVSCRGETFALPVHSIERLLRVKLAEMETIEGKPMVSCQTQPIPLVSLSRLLGGQEAEFNIVDGTLPVVIVRSGSQRLALAVDELVAEGEFLISELSGPAAGFTKFAGGIVLSSGKVALVIQPGELLKGLSAIQRGPATRALGRKSVAKPLTILVVDDSFTTRTLEKSILETHGYHVRVAVDGIEALTQLSAGHIDVVISDVQMPRLDGFGLLDRIKNDQRLKHIPVILVTSLDRREDQERGLALGANAYIIKRKFDHEDLLSTIERTIAWQTKSA